jgi:hypothetical protein
VPAAPPVVLICSEACALAEASSWFVSRCALQRIAFPAFRLRCAATFKAVHPVGPRRTRLPSVVVPTAFPLSPISPWLPASSFLGTLRDMGNEQHRFFLHAVAMIGGEPLAKVDMEAYM